MKQLRFFVVLYCLCSAPICYSQISDYDNRIAQMGGILNDLSEADKITIEEPKCAYLNITGIDYLPTSKSVDKNGWICFYDGKGNYFKKRGILKLQGNSSVGFPKKNFTIDFCEDEWIGDKETKFDIGNWVQQSSFHIKANYVDYFRGITAVGYKWYDQISVERGRMWMRSVDNIDNPDPDARCYPDGFPCIVYLNGDFYGIFSWQLKKNRKNMNQQKKKLSHIHLDGLLDDNTLWGGNIEWTKFEVRNPGNLYTMNGGKYDGDNPEELIDETSPYFSIDTDEDKVKLDKRNTKEVKEFITNFSRVNSYLSELEGNGTTRELMRAEISRFFDIDGIIDYIVFFYVTANYDGFKKNWQWFTYDGIKWIVAPYDLDCLFGGVSFGGYLVTPEYTHVGSSYMSLSDNGPMHWMKNYFNAEIVNRYRELREKSIIDAGNIKSFVKKWISRIDENDFLQEWEKWPQSPCINEIECNSNWLFINSWDGYYSTEDYDSEKRYEAGDRCRYIYAIWEATGTTQNVIPYKKIGYHDSFERICDWIEKRIELLDMFFAYNATCTQTAYSLVIPESKWTTLCVPFSFSIPDNIRLYTVNGYDKLSGKLVLERTSEPEANNPYLVEGLPGEYLLSGNLMKTDSLDNNYLVNRFLRGSYDNIIVPLDSYTLQDGVFKKVRNNNTSIKSNEAYLLLHCGDDEFTLYNIETPTSLMNLDKRKDSFNSFNQVYNLNGTMLNRPNKGINIFVDKNRNVYKVVK